eukprot:scaffold2529_cov363-Prasinococcus_capsulatus_cf.AAC.6
MTRQPRERPPRLHAGAPEAKLVVGQDDAARHEAGVLQARRQQLAGAYARPPATALPVAAAAAVAVVPAVVAAAVVLGRRRGALPHVVDEHVARARLRAAPPSSGGGGTCCQRARARRLHEACCVPGVPGRSPPDARRRPPSPLAPPRRPRRGGTPRASRVAARRQSRARRRSRVGSAGATTATTAGRLTRAGNEAAAPTCCEAHICTAVSLTCCGSTCERATRLGVAGASQQRHLPTLRGRATLQAVLEHLRSHAPAPPSACSGRACSADERDPLAGLASAHSARGRAYLGPAIGVVHRDGGRRALCAGPSRSAAAHPRGRLLCRPAHATADAEAAELRCAGSESDSSASCEAWRRLAPAPVARRLRAAAAGDQLAEASPCGAALLCTAASCWLARLGHARIGAPARDDPHAAVGQGSKQGADGPARPPRPRARTPRPAPGHRSPRAPARAACLSSCVLSLD